MLRPSPSWTGLALLAALSILVLPVAALAADDDVVDEVLAILHERGMVDENEYLRLRQKQERWKASRSKGPHIEWSGDLRGRHEQFWFDRDALGNDRGDLGRARYRFRLRGEAHINEHVSAVFRIASGQGSSRSANTTLGDDNDFAPDDVFIDQAYLELTAPEGTVPGKARLRLGKMGVPFRWKASPDSILWDRDLQVEGVSLFWDAPETNGIRPYVRAAYLIAQENATRRDPHVLGLQLGADIEFSRDWHLGVRLTHYEWGSLDPAFVGRAALRGSLGDGLVGDASGSDGLSATEVAAYLRYEGLERWPIQLYGHVMRNHDAESSAGADESDTGLAVGFTMGDKREVAQFGAGWYRMEANAWPAQFVDSPLLGGRTNQKALAFHVVREILTNTDFRVTLVLGDEVSDDLAYSNSLAASDRTLLQTDLMVRF